MFPRPILLAATLASWAFAAQSIQVAAGSDGSAAIQAAIDGCHASSCRIELPDSLYVLKKQIWIQLRDSLELVGTFPRGRTTLAWDSALLRKVANPLAGANLAATVPGVFALTPPSGMGRPVLPAGWLMWPCIGAADGLPPTSGPVGSATDTSSKYSTSGFQRNGMFLVENSSATSFRHLVLDGIRPVYFLNKTIWSQRYDILFGNVGVNFFHGRMGTVADCELKNFWSALYLNDRNPACFGALNPSDVAASLPGKYSDCGALGGHLVEGNEIHGNWWAAYSENAWDMGSVFRGNLAWNDRNQRLAHSGDPDYDFGGAASDAMADNPGGFLFEKDVVYPAHVVDHNTMRQVLFPYAWNGYRAAGHALWSDNLVDSIPQSWNGLAPADDWRQIMTRNSMKTQGHLRRNTFVVSCVGMMTVQGANILDSAFATYAVFDTDAVTGRIDTAWKTATMPWWATVSQPYAIPYMVRAPYHMVPQVGDTMVFTAVDGKGVARQEKSWGSMAYDSVGWLGPQPILRVGPAALDSTWWQNKYSLGMNFAGGVGQGRAGMMPVFLDPNTARAIQGPFGARGAHGVDGSLGSQTPIGVRPAGTPWWDSASGRLHLPVRFDSKGRSVDRFIVREGQLTAMTVLDGTVSNPGQLSKEVLLDLGAAEAMGSNPTEIVLPYSGSDTLLQLDLWPAAVSGSDTLMAGAVTWVWAKGMRAPRIEPTSIGARASSKILSTGRDALGWYAVVAGPAVGFRLASPGGRTIAPAVESAGANSRLRFPAARSGVWLLTGPGVSRRILVGTP